MTEQDLQHLVNQCNAIAREYYPGSFCSVSQTGYFQRDCIGGHFWANELTVRIHDEESGDRLQIVGGIGTNNSTGLLRELRLELIEKGPEWLGPATPKPQPPRRSWIGTGQNTTRPAPHPFAA